MSSYSYNQNIECSKNKQYNKDNSFKKEIDNSKIYEYNIELYKKVLSNFVSNPNSIYPSLKSCSHGDTGLEDIKNYLISNKNNNSIISKIWPNIFLIS